MQIISYAQNYEDIMLWRALKHINKGFYIDIGAAWPVFDSVTKLFYDKGWRGINIEPNPILYQEFERQRLEDTNINAAISSNSTQSEFFIAGTTGLSTADKVIVNDYKKRGVNLEPVQAKFLTLNDVWKHFVGKQDVHFLKIDVEGLETSIIESNDWINNRPWILVIEAIAPLTQEACYIEWEYTLLDAGYIYAYQDGLNRFYVATEHSDLLKSLLLPPNVFDNFVKYRADDEYANEVVLLKMKIETLRNELSGITGSHSWKITAPLRKIAQGIKSLCKKIVVANLIMKK